MKRYITEETDVDALRAEVAAWRQAAGRHEYEAEMAHGLARQRAEKLRTAERELAEAHALLDEALGIIRALLKWPGDQRLAIIPAEQFMPRGFAFLRRTEARHG